MDIYDDIERATHIPYVNDNTLFVPTRRSRHPAIRHRPVRNTELLEDDTPDLNTEEYQNILQDRVLNQGAIHAKIQMANGGLSYSNQDMEEYWKAEQAKASEGFGELTSTLAESSICSSKKSNTKETDKGNYDCGINAGEKETDNPVEQKTENEEKILKVCKLSKNAAIKGLIRNQIISIENLNIPNKGDNESTASAPNAEDGKVSSTFENTNGQLVPWSEDPDILITPLQAYGTIDESKHKDIDFTVDRLGKKKVFTPQQYYIYEMDDSKFDFVKRDPKPKQ